MRLKATAVLLLLGLSASIAQAQRALEPTTAQKLRELGCREQAARDMQKPVQLPPGTSRAWEFELAMREKLCMQKAAQADEAELQTHRHYRAQDGHEVHSAAKSMRDQVPVGASAKCRDGTYSLGQDRRGTCSPSDGGAERH